MKPLRWTAVLCALALGLPAAHAQTASGGPELSVSAQAQPAAVLAGDTFAATWTVSNQGSADAPDTTISIYLPPEVETTEAPANCTTEPPAEGYPAPMQPADTPTSGGAAAPERGVVGAPYGGTLFCSLGTLAPGTGASITVAAERISARAVYLSGWAATPAPESNFDDNHREVFLEPDTSRPADLGLRIDGPATPAVGGTFTFALTVVNAGPSAGQGVRVVFPLPYGLEYLGSSGSRPGDGCNLGGGALVCTFGVVEDGQSATASIEMRRATAWEVYSSAWLMSFSHDDLYHNDYAWHLIESDPSVRSDLAFTVTGPASTPLVGDTSALTFAVRNDGPSAAVDVGVWAHIPPELTVVSVSHEEACWTGSEGGYADQPMPARESGAYYPVPSGGVSCAFGSLGAGATEEVVVKVQRTGARPGWVSGWVATSNHDPDYEDNYDDIEIGPDKTHPVDLSLLMTADPRTPVGTDMPVSIEVRNGGPATASKAEVTIGVPWGLEYVSADEGCTPVTYEQPPPYEKSETVWYGTHSVRCDLGDVAPGTTVTRTLTLHRSSEYEMWLGGSVWTPSYDTSWDNDYAGVRVSGKQHEGQCTSEEKVATDEPDTIIIGDCMVRGGEGGDAISVVPTSGEAGSTAYGGGGNDTIVVNLGLSSLATRPIAVYGGPGADRIQLNVAPGVGAADILIEGGGGADVVELNIPPGQMGLEVDVRGGKGDDEIAWTSGSGRYRRLLQAAGGAGRDVLTGGPAPDLLRGGDGNDRLFGGEGRDILGGGPGRRDVCRGGPGEDRVRSC